MNTSNICPDQLSGHFLPKPADNRTITLACANDRAAVTVWAHKIGQGGNVEETCLNI